MRDKYINHLFTCTNKKQFSLKIYKRQSSCLTFEKY